MPVETKILDAPRKTEYNPDPASAGPFDVGFPVFGTVDLRVFLDQIETTAFSFSGNFHDGVSIDAKITLNEPFKGHIDILGAMAPERTDQYEQGKGVPAQTHNLSLNRLWAATREQFDKLERVIIGSVDEPEPLQLPPPLVRRYRYPFFGADGLLELVPEAPAPPSTFIIDAQGPFAERTQYDSEARGYVFFATDQGNLYQKLSDGDADWSAAISLRPIIAPNSVTNEQLAQMPAFTLKARNDAAPGDAADIDIDALTEEPAPDNDDLLLLKKAGAGGAFRKVKRGSIGAGGVTGVNPRTEIAYSLALSDSGKLVTMDNPALNRVLVRANASVPFPVDTTQILVHRKGVGSTKILAEPGVTLLSEFPTPTIRSRNGVASLLKIGTDEWLIRGAVAEAAVPTRIGSLSQRASQAAESSVTVSHRTPIGCDCLVVFVGNTQLVLPSATFNGIEMQRVATGSDALGTVFYLANPFIGTADLVVTWPSAVNSNVIWADNFSGVDPSFPINNTFSNFDAKVLFARPESDRPARLVAVCADPQSRQFSPEVGTTLVAQVQANALTGCYIDYPAPLRGENPIGAFVASALGREMVLTGLSLAGA